MCGILAYLVKRGSGVAQMPELEVLRRSFGLIKHRGPDDTRDEMIRGRGLEIYLGFHRLAINGLGHDSDEPLKFGSCCLICNGEIYNYKTLAEKEGFVMRTENDCEIILHLYKKYGFDKMIRMLDGVYAMVLYDALSGEVYVANDPIGIRPLYRGWSDDGGLVFGSEPVALRDLASKVEFFPPGCYWVLKNLGGGRGETEERMVRHFYYEWTFNRLGVEDIYLKYQELLERAVDKRLMGERPICALLSGGLDSSVVCALLSKLMKKRGMGDLHTFSIGLLGSPDLKYAQEVADYIGSVHHTVVVTEEDMIRAIGPVISAVGSFDVTTVRASCGNYLVAKYIAENTDFKIVFNGDVSEEIHASYKYSTFAPSDYEFYRDNVKLLREVHKYDVLRSARCIERFGMECRTPFADRDLVNFVMSINPRLKRFGLNGEKFPMEKMLMRNAMFNMLPLSVVSRPKVAFSDGVSDGGRSWHKIIAEFADRVVSDEEFSRSEYENPLAYSKEAYLYRKVFEDLLGVGRFDMIALIGEYWMPRFIKGINDPSAREISC